MRNINGFMYGNLPGLRMCKGDDVSWHFVGGPAMQMHSAYFYGNTLIRNGNNYDTVGLMEGIVFLFYLCIVVYFFLFSSSVLVRNLAIPLLTQAASLPVKNIIDQPRFQANIPLNQCYIGCIIHDERCLVMKNFPGIGLIRNVEIF